MAWIELHQAVWTHRKTFELAARLDLDETYAAAHVIRLWTWALDNAPEGDLSSLSDRAIAFGAGWRGDAADLVSALVEVGWLDPTRQIHDWEEYAGRLAERRRANAERMRAARSQHVQRTERERVGLPDLTGPDSTGPNRTGPIPPNPPSHGEGGSPPTPRKRGARRSRGEANGVAHIETPPEPVELAPVKPEDAALWERARSELRGAMSGANWEQLVGPLVPIGRAPDGGLHLRAPPGSPSLTRSRNHVARALLDAGDQAAANVAIVEG